MTRDVRRDEISVSNHGDMSGVVIGGEHNTAMSSAGTPDDALLLEVRRVLDHIASWPLDDDGRRDVEKLSLAERQLAAHDPTGARKTLATVGAWVAAVAASLSAMLIKDHIGS